MSKENLPLKKNEIDEKFLHDQNRNVLRNRIVLFVCLFSSIFLSYVTKSGYASYIPIMLIAMIEWYRSYTKETRSFYGLCRLLIYILIISLWIVFLLKIIIESLSYLVGYRNLPINRIEHLFPYGLMFMIFARTQQDMDLNDKRRYLIHLFYDFPAFTIVILLKLLNNPLNCLCSEITPNCYLGCLPTSSDVEQLNKLGIKNVVNMCAEYGGPKKTYEKYQIKQLHLSTIDSTAPSLKSIEKAIEFLKQSLLKKEICFVHCKTGMARSATVVFCHLIVNENYSPDDAMKLLKEKRPEVTTAIMDYISVKRFLASQNK